jgi:PTH2 family peptidyl-tRNA hydrolase
MDKIKQVIIMRKDLKMNKGKCIAQGCHASLGGLLANTTSTYIDIAKQLSIIVSDRDSIEWLQTEFTKVTLAVKSEEELLEIRDKLTEAGIVHTLITDAGHTVFNGVPTNTCIGTAPVSEYKIDKITGHLKLF